MTGAAESPGIGAAPSRIGYGGTGPLSTPTTSGTIFTVSLLVLLGLFVGFDVGDASTGVAFGPAVGSRIIRKPTAAALFTGFAYLGAWTVGRNVIVTTSEGIVPVA